MVGAEGTGSVFLLMVAEIIQRIQIQEGPVFGMFVVAFPGDQRHTDGAHQAGVRRTDDLPAGIFFQRPEDGVILKGAALYHNAVPQ